MTPTQLAEIEARAKAATEGPFVGMEFCAHARQDIPDLIAHIRELEAQIQDTAHKALDFACKLAEERAAGG